VISESRLLRSSGATATVSAITLPAPLLEFLREHSATYAPHYPPSDNSDHGPMACLALHGLGIGFDEISKFADRYRRRLVHLRPPREAIKVDQWENHIGRRESYSALLAFFASAIDSHGWQATVSRYLPSLISGWVKDAFHPLIRLGYGIEFEAPSEIAAGLAYLASTGDDPRLAAIAHRDPSKSRGRAYLEVVQGMGDGAFARGSFNSRYRRISEAPSLRPVSERSDDVLEELSRACLEVFHATHNFFALHLVTSSHAYRICAPWVGPDAGALFSAGIALAYLAIGAPRFDTLPPISGALPFEAISSASDEHDIKLAYSCQMQAQAYADSTYCGVAAQYLAPRLKSKR
jgi:Questin oxidase-like